MAKGRMLQNRISKSNKIASLSSDTVRLLYTWMLAHLDVNGNFYADPVMVNNLVFTRLGHSIKTISSALDELADTGLIVRYQIDGETYLNYPDFLEKQPRLNPDREGTPDIPNITPESLLNNSGVTPTQYKIREDKISKDKPMNEGFEDFWKSYPKKVNKKEAITAFKKVSIPLDTILKAIEKQKKSDQWLKDNGQFIPYPSTWLNQERWNDELTYGGNYASKGFSTNSYRGNNNDRKLTPGAEEELERIAENLRSKQ
jgi:hypothetical protein